MKRPYVIINVAMTADGKIDSFLRRGETISSPLDKSRVDELRATVDGILVGGKTLLQEEPKLTVKSQELRQKRARLGMPENPAKIGVVSEIQIDPNEPGRQPLEKFLSSGTGKKLIFTTTRTPETVIDQLQSNGANVFVGAGEIVDLRWMLTILKEQGINRLMVEGGGIIIAELFRIECVDELSIYIAPRIFAGATSPTLADGPGFIMEQAPLLALLSLEKADEEGGVILRYRVLGKKEA